MSARRAGGGVFLPLDASKRGLGREDGRASGRLVASRTVPEAPSTMIRSASVTGLFAAAALAATAALLLPGCDNPACVFSGSCAGVGAGGGGGVGSEPASVPAAGEELLAGLPVLRRSFPTGSGADPKSPIVLVFSESMSSASLNSAFELQATGLGAIPLAVAQVVGDGHLIVLFPASDLAADTEYTVLYRQDVKVVDRAGQAVVQPTDRTIGTFSTGATAPSAPTVLASWPEDGTTNRSATSEFVAVFSRPVDAATVVDASWVVTVGGVAPPNDPLPVALTLQGLVTDTRVYRWRSTGASGAPVSLGTNVDVQLELSPTGQLIRDTGGAALANKKIKYKTLPFSAPTGAAITSIPDDAIGIAQISGPADLAVRVDFADAQAGDRLGVYVFGKEPQSTPPVPIQNLKTIALLREVPLVAPFTSFTLTAEELDLVRTASPLAARFTDTTVNFAFYVKRGAVVSGVTLLDVDPLTTGTQGPVLDTVAPTLLGLSTSGTTAATFRSDQRDLVVVGRANEALRAVAVTTTAFGDNEITPGEPAPVVGSTSGGLFVAAPVPLGVLTAAQMPVTYSVVLYDRALNATTPATGSFTQVGAASNGDPAPFSNVFVEVVNAETLAPVANASVHLHENVAGIVSAVASTTTDSNGRATLTPPLIGEAIVTVDATNQGFDLFTFDGLPTDRLSVPLQPSAQAAAAASGSVTTSDTNFALYTKAVSDTRFGSTADTSVSASSCGPQSGALACTFGPAAIQARRLGAQSAVVVLDPTSPVLYTALTYLKGFSLSIPLAPVEPGATQTNALATGTSLDSGTLDPEERPIDVPAVVLNSAAYPTLASLPRVRVEANAPGLARSLTVGRGIAFNDLLPPNTYAVRAAYPGSVDPVVDATGDELGRFVEKGTIEPRLRLRMECVDTAGNRGGARPDLPSGAATFTALAPPVLAGVPFDAQVGSDAIDLLFANVITDASGQEGLYRVTVTDALGTAWTVWALDPPDASGATVRVRLPLIGAGGTLPLVSGDVDVQVSAYAWTGLDPEALLWSDVEREFQSFAHTAVTTATPPP